MIAGFTGTQLGMTYKQGERLLLLLKRLNTAEMHHGDCIGADAEVHVMCLDLGIRTVGHPPIVGDKRAFCSFDFEHPPLPYLERDNEIVQQSEVLFAAPKEAKEQLRSGTWATIRYARKKGLPIFIVRPDGTWTDGGSKLLCNRKEYK